MCAGAQRRFQHKPAVLSWFQSVARVTVSLMLHNIRLKKMKQRQFLSFYWPDQKKSRLRPLNFFFFVVNESRVPGALCLLPPLTSSKLHFANYLCLMSVCLALAANLSPDYPNFFSIFFPNLYFITVAPVKRGRNKSLFVIKPQRLACCWCLEAKLFKKKEEKKQICADHAGTVAYKTRSQQDL